LAQKKLDPCRYQRRGQDFHRRLARDHRSEKQDPDGFALLPPSHHGAKQSVGDDRTQFGLVIDNLGFDALMSDLKNGAIGSKPR
jgi:hypothetical protein